MTEEKKNELSLLYNRNKDDYKHFTNKMGKLVNEILSSAKIKGASVSFRTKNLDSIIDKIDRKTYNDLEEVTDISGVRIVCLFNDQVKKISELIKKNFEVDPNNYENKIDHLEVDKFGYLSVHYVVKLKNSRARLSEFRSFKDYVLEIQVRSMLQHVWAEIEHDLGYKSNIEVPREARRRFFRLAGLLEIADDEFVNLKEYLSKYKSRIKKSLSTNIAAISSNILIDKASLIAYLDSTKTAKNLDDKIGEIAEASYSPNYNRVDIDLLGLKFFNIKTIHDLEQIITRYSDRLLKFSKIWFDSHKTGKVLSKHVFIFFMFYVLSIFNENGKTINDYINMAPFSSDAKKGLIKELNDIKAKLVDH